MSKKADLIIHPIRMRLVTEIRNREMTTRQLASALSDIPQATLYRHIKKLHDGGIFRVVSETLVNGAIERTYSLVQQQNRLQPEELVALTPDQHIQYFSIFATGLIDAFSRYISRDTADMGADGASYNQASIYLSDQEREQFQEQLLQVVGKALTHKPTAERKRYMLASVVIPEQKQKRNL